MTDLGPTAESTRTVLLLCFFLLVLIVMLFLLYKKLNRETDGEYTIQRIVYKEGGVRDRVRGAAVALETRLGVQLWPRSDTDEEGEEMQEVQDEEGQVEEGDSQGNDSEEDDQGEEEVDDVEQCGKTKGNGGDTSEENSSLEGSEGEEETTLIDQPKAEGKKGEEQEGKVGDGKGEASGGTGLLIDLKQFSGSAIWSEEEGGDGKVMDVTPL